MCCTIATGTGRERGSEERSVARAFGPPVEVPMTTMSNLEVAGTGSREGSGGGVVFRGRVE